MLPSLEADAALRELVDEYRDRCLWFLRRDYYPATAEEAQGVLDSIQRHGNRDGFRRAAQIRQWLSLAPRLSRDIDLFHDTEAALAASWAADRRSASSPGISWTR